VRCWDFLSHCRGKEIPTRRDLAERALDEAQAAQFAALLPQKPPAAE
jgi:hypothetical protein